MSQTKRLRPASVETRGAPPPRLPTNSDDSSPDGAAGCSGGCCTCAEPGAVEAPGCPAVPPEGVGVGRGGALAVNFWTGLPAVSMNSSVTSEEGRDLR